MAKILELTINFLNSSITTTKTATAMIMPQSLIDNTLVESSPPISKLVNGMVKSASCTKNSNSPNETKNAMLIALLENTPKEKILSS